jgi:hypothetical protein
MMTYEEHFLALQSAEPFVAGQLNPLNNLQSILKWIPTAGLSLDKFDSIQQDEYNYDVIFQWHDHRWIAFGVT